MAISKFMMSIYGHFIVKPTIYDLLYIYYNLRQNSIYDFM